MEALEDHPDLAAQSAQFGCFRGRLGAVFGPSAADLAAFEQDSPLLIALEPVETAQEGGFAAAVGAQDGENLALGDAQGDALEDLLGAAEEALLEAFDLKDGVFHLNVRALGRA